LVDERYGPVGHADSNWAQLLKAGFNPKKAHILPILQHGVSFAHTVEAYEFTLREALRRSDIVIAQLGIGDDGHTAGILPNSPACDQTDNLVVAYSSVPYERITVTFKTLKRIDIAFALVYGDTKKIQLEKLEFKKIALSKQPAQILKVIKEAYVYNGR
jgi:6-phosphogluconolactonase/glucosamine-6-phosphate isomerase/deaminase